jgi:uncharacterized membrane protein YfcA
MAMFGKPSERDDSRELAYRQWFGRQHPLALPSLIFSAFSLTHFGTLWVDEIAGIVLGVIALVQLSRARRATVSDDSAPREGVRIAAAGVVVGATSFAIAVTVYFVLPTRR